MYFLMGKMMKAITDIWESGEEAVVIEKIIVCGDNKASTRGYIMPGGVM